MLEEELFARGTSAFSSFLFWLHRVHICVRSDNVFVPCVLSSASCQHKNKNTGGIVSGCQDVCACVFGRLRSILLKSHISHRGIVLRLRCVLSLCDCSDLPCSWKSFHSRAPRRGDLDLHDFWTCVCSELSCPRFWNHTGHRTGIQLAHLNWVLNF